MTETEDEHDRLIRETVMKWWWLPSRKRAVLSAYRRARAEHRLRLEAEAARDIAREQLAEAAPLIAMGAAHTPGYYGPSCTECGCPLSRSGESDEYECRNCGHLPLGVD